LNGVQLVTSDTVKNNNVLLSSLEGINCVNFEVLKFTVGLTQPRTESILQPIDLRLVRSDNRYFSAKFSEAARGASYLSQHFYEVKGERYFIPVAL
jgi:hypothetical protein